MLKYYIDSPPGKCSGPTDHTLRTAGSRTLAPSFIHVFQPHVPVTISASTVSQVRAIVITCVATFLVLYTFSSIFHLTPTPASSNVEHHPPTDTLAPSHRWNKLARSRRTQSWETRLNMGVKNSQSRKTLYLTEFRSSCPTIS